MGRERGSHQDRLDRHATVASSRAAEWSYAHSPLRLGSGQGNIAKADKRRAGRAFFGRSFERVDNGPAYRGP